MCLPVFNNNLCCAISYQLNPQLLFEKSFAFDLSGDFRVRRGSKTLSNIPKSSSVQPDKIKKADGQNNKICLSGAVFILQHKFTKKFQCNIILFSRWTVHSTLSFSYKEFKNLSFEQFKQFSLFESVSKL